MTRTERTQATNARASTWQHHRLLGAHQGLLGRPCCTEGLAEPRTPGGGLEAILGTQIDARGGSK